MRSIKRKDSQGKGNGIPSDEEKRKDNIEGRDAAEPLEKRKTDETTRAEDRMRQR